MPRESNLLYYGISSVWNMNISNKTISSHCVAVLTCVIYKYISYNQKKLPYSQKISLAKIFKVK